MENNNLKLKNNIIFGNVFSGYINGLLVKSYYEMLSDDINEYIDFKLDKFDEIDNVDKLFEEIGDILYVMGDNYDDYYSEFLLCMDNLEFELFGEDVELEDNMKKLLIDKFKCEFKLYME